jgi:epoxyqueuosine reductase
MPENKRQWIAIRLTSADDLQEELSDLVRVLNIDLFGVADLASAHNFIMVQAGDHIARFPRAISIGIRLPDAIVDELYRHEEPSAISSYRALYNSANSALNIAALVIAGKTQEAGFRAYPIPASQTASPRRLEGAFSHKLAAHLAGLGWIGKSCLLITPDHGPRLRLATVLTDAPMQPGNPLSDRCGDCRKCVEVCPVGAFTGVNFDPSEPRDVRFRAHLCNDYSERRARFLGEDLCGLCVHICPYGKNK